MLLAIRCRCKPARLVTLLNQCAEGDLAHHHHAVKGDARASLPQIARDLNVDGVIEGSVLRARDRVRISAQLIHAATDTHVWAQHYERSLDDVLAVHGDVARAIAQEIKIKLTADERQRLARSPLLAFRMPTRRISEVAITGGSSLRTGSTKLVTIFFRRSRWIRRSRHRMPRSRTFTLRLVRMVWCVPRTPSVRRKRPQSARSDLDPNLADAHRTLGFIRMYQWDWPGAEAAFQAALAAAPGATEAHGHYALYLIVRGRCAEAVASAEHARSLDPLSPMIGNDLALALWTAHRHEEALDRYRQSPGARAGLRRIPSSAPAAPRISRRFRCCSSRTGACRHTRARRGSARMPRIRTGPGRA